eukprot:TRINITY_DN480_c0_g6_i1.p1 TRINITY_DN480_c0_g6~~TRINITY_DN480_c0_g6_i1.p1  ORF type:complete len:976 (-),score=280.31 TRINITY_DN480_c0_g6_i1:102-2975(-)
MWPGACGVGVAGSAFAVPQLAQLAQQQQQLLQQQALQQQALQQQQQALQQQQQAAQGGCTAVVQAAPAGAQHSLQVHGCQHATVAAICHGSFSLAGQNHGKNMYKKDAPVNGTDILLYFWDDRDGANMSGWWFGPKVGGDQVWAYHSDKIGQMPPQSGWRVPYDGPVDEKFTVQSVGQAQDGAPQMQQMQQMQQPQQQMQLAQNPLPPPPTPPPQWAQQPAGILGGGLIGGCPQLQLQQQQMQQLQLQQQQQQQQQQMLLQQQQMMQQQAEQKRLLEEKRKQHLAAESARREEIKKRREAEEMKKKENFASMDVRKFIQKLLRQATPENFADVRVELEQAVSDAAPNLGSRLEAIKTEVSQAIETVQTRVNKILELRKLEQQKRDEEAQKFNELETLANELTDNFEKLVVASESITEKMVEVHKRAEEHVSSGDGKNADESLRELDALSTEAKMAALKCAEFIKENGEALKGAKSTPNKRPTPEELIAQQERKTKLSALVARSGEAMKSIDESMKAGNVQVELRKKAKKAEERLAKQKETFKKYNSKKDGVLSAADVKKFVTGEYGITLSSNEVRTVIDRAVGSGAQGIPFERLYHFTVAVGISREIARDEMRKAEAKQKQAEIDGLKAKLADRINAAKVVVDSADETVKGAEEKANPLYAKAASMDESHIIQLADETDKVIEEASVSAKAANQALHDLVLEEDGEFADDMRAYAMKEAKQLLTRCARFDLRLCRIRNLSKKSRTRADAKRAERMHKLSALALKVLKYNQKLKKLEPQQLFESLHGEPEGELLEAEFLKFFASADMEVVDEKPPVAKAGDESQAADGEAASAVERHAEKIALTDEELAQVFTFLRSSRDVKEEGGIPKDRFLEMLRTHVKVAKEIVLTSAPCIRDSKAIRRLEKDEVLEIVDGPLLDESLGVDRLRLRAKKDGADGWCSVVGNRGTKFLQTVMFSEA